MTLGSIDHLPLDSKECEDLWVDRFRDPELEVILKLQREQFDLEDPE